MDSYNGAGLYATTYSTPTRVLGRYAAYFEGATNISGTLTAMEMVTPSDERLMENVVLLGGSRSSEELDNLMDIDVFQYSYTDKALIGEANETDSIRISVRTCNSFKKESGREHYGISANKLQKIYPALVREGQDGYLGINYVELVPILIRSIQELKAELDEVKGNDGCARRAPLVNAVTTPATYQARLYQNTPNPFTAQTEIRFSLPDDVKDAYICIFDMTGKMLKKTPISSDMSSITVNGYELDEGIYLYSLVVNGQEIDTKRMVLTK